MAEDHVIDAVAKRIKQLKRLLGSSVHLLVNRIGHCKCAEENPCVECKANDSLVKEIGQALEGGNHGKDNENEG